MIPLEIKPEDLEWVELNEMNPMKVTVEYKPPTKLERFQETLRNAWNKSMNSMAAKGKK